MADKMDIVDELLDLIENLDSPIMDEASDRDIELMAYIPMLRSAIEEVERLREALDQRTVARCPWCSTGRPCSYGDDHPEHFADPRLLGGDQ